MSEDTYIPVSDYPVREYKCGLRVGDKLRLLSDIECQDHNGNPTGEVLKMDDICTVLPGTLEEPPIVWLQQPDGSSHT